MLRSRMAVAGTSADPLTIRTTVLDLQDESQGRGCEPIEHFLDRHRWYVGTIPWIRTIAEREGRRRIKGPHISEGHRTNLARSIRRSVHRVIVHRHEMIVRCELEVDLQHVDAVCGGPIEGDHGVGREEIETASMCDDQRAPIPDDPCFARISIPPGPTCESTNTSPMTSRTVLRRPSRPGPSSMCRSRLLHPRPLRSQTQSISRLRRPQAPMQGLCRLRSRQITCTDGGRRPILLERPVRGIVTCDAIDRIDVGARRCRTSLPW